MAKMSNTDYDTLEKFIQTVVKRLVEGKTTPLSAEADIMHPLTAWDQGNALEFIPWIKLTMKEWADDDAS